jgi:16S rRNA (uracil1498-N3)-methyltransferase
MHRFFVDKAAIAGGAATLAGEDVKHIANVLRLRAGDTITLCDGEGNEYAARIQAIGAKVQCAVGEAAPAKGEPLHRVTLYQGLPKAGKMETVIQKCVELGAFAIVPVAAQRSVVKLTAKDYAGKRARYQRVAYEAAKQARRGIIPQIGELCSFFTADFRSHDLVIIADEEERVTTLKAALQTHAGLDIALVVGPEGGLAREEAEALRARGGIAVTLGKRILRTETAGMAMLAMTLYEWEG